MKSAVIGALCLVVIGCTSLSHKTVAPVPITNNVSFSGDYVNQIDALPKPKALELPTPVYPKKFSESGIRGEATVHFIVEKDGTPSEIQISEATDSAFADAARDAIAHAKYTRGGKNGVGMRVHMMEILEFYPDARSAAQAKALKTDAQFGALPANYGNQATNWLTMNLRAGSHDKFTFDKPRRGIAQGSAPDGTLIRLYGWIVHVSVEPVYKPESYLGPHYFYLMFGVDGTLKEVTDLFCTGYAVYAEQQ